MASLSHLTPSQSIVLVQRHFAALLVNVTYYSSQMAQKQRLNHCLAPGCNTGYSRTKQAQKLSLFKAPPDPERSVWECYLCRRDRSLTPYCPVCALHFEKRFIVKDYVHDIIGTDERTKRGTPTLAADAVPTILPNIAPYSNKCLPPKRNKTKRKSQDILPKKKGTSDFCRQA